MVNRRRNLILHIRLTKEEKELIKSVANLKGMTITDLLIQWTKKEYEKIENENKEMEETNNEAKQ